MEYIYVCLSSDQSTGDEAQQIPAVCPKFEQGWSEEEAEAAGYVAPWNNFKSVPVRGFNDGENFEPFHNADAPGEQVPHAWRREVRW